MSGTGGGASGWFIRGDHHRGVGNGGGVDGLQ